MATSPRASAPSGVGPTAQWTIVRPFGARAIPTSGATQGNEALFIQTFQLEEGEKSGDPVRDLRALMNLRHANVARIKEVNEKDREVTVVTHYAEGETLQALRAHGPIQLGVQLRILVDVLSGLAAIHGVKDARLKPLGIVHGEVAPANIVVGLDGIPKLIQLCGVHASPGAQGPDTLGYLAPEILLADDAFDHRVDIYAVGVMLWEALSGQQLFPETNAGAIVTRHLSGRIRKATVPEDARWAEPLIDVAQKAIATDPNGRYATANELANEIKRIAKTNLAATMKVALLVRERGSDAIAQRRSSLGLPASAAIKPIAAAPKPFEKSPAAPAVALKPVPTPADAAPTTKPVPASAFLAELGEDLSESAVKPAVRFPPHDADVHERQTLKTPIPSGIEPVKIETKKDDDVADFSDLHLESEPPPAPPVVPPPRVPPNTAMNIAPSPIQEPVINFADPPAMNLSPPPAIPGFSAEPAATPPLGEAIEGLPGTDDPEKKKKRILFIAAGAAALLILIFGLRSCLKSGAPEATKTTKPVETAEPAKTTTEPTATVAATNTATAEPTTPPVATNTATTKPAETTPPPAETTTPPPVATKATPPPATGAPPAYTGKPAPTSTKPKKTYDPLGI
jgi:serine/threonine protein kinase